MSKNAEGNRLTELNEEFEPIYNELTDVLCRLENFCYIRMFITDGLTSKTIDLLKEVAKKSGELHDISHNLEEHLAWD